MIYNLRITYPNEKLLFLNNNMSRAFRHVKYYLDVASTYSFVIRNNLHIPLGSIFSSNIIRYK